MHTETDKRFGNIQFNSNARLKNLSVRIKPDGIIVNMPLHLTKEKALKFVNDNAEKIISKQKLISDKKESNSLIINSDTKLKTLSFETNVIFAERKNLHFLLKNGILNIEVPHNFVFENGQKDIWNGINYFLKKEAKRLLPSRLAQLAQHYNFKFASVKIQSAKTQWGSCSGAKDINLSMYLMLLPSHLIDYVLLHELCHTIEMNHSEHFWALMNKVTNNKSKQLRAELKKYSMP